MNAADAKILDECSCPYELVFLDFQTRTERQGELRQIHEALDGGQFVWLELSLADRAAAHAALSALCLVERDTVTLCLNDDPGSSCARYERYLHLVLTSFTHTTELEVGRVDVILGERFMFTLYRQPLAFLGAVRREYRHDFIQFAKTPSFLLFEIWDQLLQNYFCVQKGLEERAVHLQALLKADSVDDGVFRDVAELSADLLRFRRVVLPARGVLSELAHRKSLFVSETTQHAIANLLASIEHILNDLVTDRELLSEAVNLYMSAVTHRTNEVMKRLTVVSIVFLPLTFIVGVYGMNFDYLPELKWQYGYVYFWGLVSVVVVGLLLLLRRARFW